MLLPKGKNMKKLIVVSLLIICGGAGLLYQLSVKQHHQLLSASQFLPENVLLYAEHQDVARIYKEFKQSKLGQTLADMDILEVIRELGVPADQVSEAQSIVDKVSTFIDGPVFNELLGKEFAVALYPAKSFPTGNPALALEERLILIARPRHNVQVLEFLSSLIADDIEKSTVQYGSYTISRYKLDETRTVSAVTVQDLVLLAIDERLVRKSLDLYDEKTATLEQNVEYRRLRKRLELSKLFTYISFSSLLEQGRMISEKLSDEEKNEFLSLLEQWKGWGGAAYGVWKEGSLLQEKALIHYDIGKLDPRIVKLCSVQPSKNETLSMVPAEVLFYYWTNTLNLPLLWEIYSSILIKHSGDMDLLHQEILDVTGVEFEELLEMIGHEVAVLVQDIDSNGIPLPKAALIVKVTNPQQFMGAFNKILVAADIPISEKEYKGVDISYWGVAPQSGLQPAFSFQDEYLFISNSTDVIKQIIDLQANGSKSFLEKDSVQRVTGNWTLENSVAFVDIAGLAEVLKNLASWAGSMASLQGPEAERSANTVINQIVFPLLDGIGMYSTLGSRSIIEDNTIILESTISVHE